MFFAKKSKSIFNATGIATAILCCLPSLSHASIISSTSVGSMNLSVSGDFSGTDGRSETLLGFSLFDSALGNLTSVSISFENRVDEHLHINNPIGQSGSYSLTSNIGFQLGNFSNGLSSTANGNTTNSVSGLIPGQSSLFFEFAPSTSTTLLTFSNPSDLSLFVGNGFLLIDGTLFHHTTLGVGVPTTDGFPDFNGLASLRSIATITYTFEDAISVPEPSGVMLLALGLLGLGVRRSRA